MTTVWISETDGFPTNIVEQANRMVAYLISGAVYPAAKDGSPALKQHQQACKDAAQAQARWLRDGGAQAAGGFRIGSVSITAASGRSGELAAAGICPDAYLILQAAGLGWRVV